jgi:mannitol-specific phosphotransferase system IIBC component
MATQATTRNRIIGAVVAIVVAVIVSFGVRMAFQAFGGDSKEDAIAENVEQAREQYDLPQQIDEVTVLEDITAESDAIHYHYTLAGDGVENVTEELLAASVLPQLCSTAATRDILDRDIGMKYSYDVEGTGDQLEMAFSKSDCA